MAPGLANIISNMLRKVPQAQPVLDKKARPPPPEFVLLSFSMLVENPTNIQRAVKYFGNPLYGLPTTHALPSFGSKSCLLGCSDSETRVPNADHNDCPYHHHDYDYECDYLLLLTTTYYYLLLLPLPPTTTTFLWYFWCPTGRQRLRATGEGPIVFKDFLSQLLILRTEKGGHQLRPSV